MVSSPPSPISFDKVIVSQAKWTVEQENTLIDIMVEHVDKGNRLNKRFSGPAWKKIAVEFNMKTGKKYKLRQFQSKYTKLKKRYKAFTDLKKLPTGFGWDPNLNTATAPDNVWERYIMVHPEAKRFRRETCPKYEKLMTIFGDMAAMGKEAPTSTQDVIIIDDDFHDTNEDIQESIDNVTFGMEADSRRQRNLCHSRDETASDNCCVRSHHQSRTSSAIDLLIEACFARTEPSYARSEA